MTEAEAYREIALISIILLGTIPSWFVCYHVGKKLAKKYIK